MVHARGPSSPAPESAAVLVTNLVVSCSFQNSPPPDFPVSVFSGSGTVPSWCRQMVKSNTREDSKEPAVVFLSRKVTVNNMCWVRIETLSLDYIKLKISLFIRFL